MVGSTKQERDSHILRPEVPEAPITNVHTEISRQNHSHPIVSHRQCSEQSILPYSHPSHPEPASLVINNVCTPGVYPMTVGEMGNVVMQSAGDNTDQYVVLIGNIPWKEKWQDLKDLVRQWTPNIERAEIYTTDGRSRGFGYVRIKGLEDAKKVKEKLDGFTWDGRALVAMLGNLKYGCPVGGVTRKLGSGQRLLPQHSNAPGAAYHSPFGGEGFHTPPLRYYGTSALSGTYPNNPLDLDAYQAYTFYVRLTAFHLTKSNQLLAEMTEARRYGRVCDIEEYQKQFNIHREAGRQAQCEMTRLERTIQMGPTANAALVHPVRDVYCALGYGYSPYPSQMMSPTTSVANPPSYPPDIENPGCPMMSGASSGDSSSFTNYVHVTPTPIYVIPPNGLPVNWSHGVVQTECRSVFIGNLPYDTTWKELKAFLEGSLRVDVPRNTNNRAKGHATATFESSEAAERSCLRFNNSMFKGRQIRVRMDRFCATKQSNSESAKILQGSTDVENSHTTSVTGNTRGSHNMEKPIPAYMPPVVVNGSRV